MVERLRSSVALTPVVLRHLKRISFLCEKLVTLNLDGARSCLLLKLSLAAPLLKPCGILKPREVAFHAFGPSERAYVCPSTVY